MKAEENDPRGSFKKKMIQEDSSGTFKRKTKENSRRFNKKNAIPDDSRRSGTIKKKHVGEAEEEEKARRRAAQWRFLVLQGGRHESRPCNPEIRPQPLPLGLLEVRNKSGAGSRAPWQPLEN